MYNALNKTSGFGINIHVCMSRASGSICMCVRQDRRGSLGVMAVLARMFNVTINRTLLILSSVGNVFDKEN